MRKQLLYWLTPVFKGPTMQFPGMNLTCPGIRDENGLTTVAEALPPGTKVLGYLDGEAVVATLDNDGVPDSWQSITKAEATKKIGG